MGACAFWHLAELGGGFWGAPMGCTQGPVGVGCPDRVHANVGVCAGRCWALRGLCQQVTPAAMGMLTSAWTCWRTPAS